MKTSRFSKSSVSAALLGYVIFFTSLLVHKLDSAHFTVIGPDETVTASIGDEAILRCHLSPKMNLEHMEVRWFRSKFSSSVHLYRDRTEQLAQQTPDYRGWTELLKDGMADGRVALKIRTVRFSDAGRYSCFFRSNVSSEEALVELKIAASGLAPVISVEDYQDKGIRIECQSTGWYPEPELQWTDFSGNPLPSLAGKKSQSENGMFSVDTVLVVTEKSVRNLSCAVRNSVLKEEKVSSVYISDVFFPRVPHWFMVLLSMTAFLVLCISLVTYFYWTQRKETVRLCEKTRKLQEEMKWRKLRGYAVRDLPAFMADSHGEGAVNVTLDPDSAHPELILSEDRKCVHHGDMRQNLPNNAERFDYSAIVLGSEGFTDGRHYWEIEVKDKTDWDLGVCLENVDRKKKVIASPTKGYWVIVQRAADTYMALTEGRTPIRVNEKPKQIGVLLDCREGKVSFYNVTNGSHMHTFSAKFTGTVRPFFSPWYSGDGKNAAPLKLCDVKDWD